MVANMPIAASPMAAVASQPTIFSGAGRTTHHGQA
jgi:hypothetical protein